MSLKLKVNFALQQAMKAQKRMNIQLHSFFNLGSRSGWVENDKPQPLQLRKWSGTHCIEGWVGGRAGLGECRISCIH
jgi:hypothetical protein